MTKRAPHPKYLGNTWERFPVVTGNDPVVEMKRKLDIDVDKLELDISLCNHCPMFTILNSKFFCKAKHKRLTRTPKLICIYKFFGL